LLCDRSSGCRHLVNFGCDGPKRFSRFLPELFCADLFCSCENLFSAIDLSLPGAYLLGTNLLFRIWCSHSSHLLIGIGNTPGTFLQTNLFIRVSNSSSCILSTYLLNSFFLET